jgi:hypothetical protein
MKLVHYVGNNDIYFSITGVLLLVLLRMLQNIVNSAQLWFECCSTSCLAKKPLNGFSTVLVLTGLLRNVSGKFNFVSTCVSIALFVHEYHIEFCAFTAK